MTNVPVRMPPPDHPTSEILSTPRNLRMKSTTALMSAVSLSLLTSSNGYFGAQDAGMAFGMTSFCWAGRMLQGSSIGEGRVDRP